MPKGRPKHAAASARELHVGRAVFMLRRAQELDQAALARQAKVASDTLGRLERAEVSPSLSSLFRVADGLGLSLVAVMLAAELVEQKGAKWLLRRLRGLEAQAVEDKIAAASKVRGLRGDDD